MAESVNMTNQTIVKAEELERLVKQLAQEIANDVKDESPVVALVGVRSRGEILAQRLQALLAQNHQIHADRGTLDITLYRDDLNRAADKQPVVKTTEIDFDINDRLIVLVDDVLQTGRSTRAAMDALIDLGRPEAIRLAVLIDRGQRELPIRADYVAKTITTTDRNQKVSVHFHETDGCDEVVFGND